MLAVAIGEPDASLVTYPERMKDPATNRGVGVWLRDERGRRGRMCCRWWRTGLAAVRGAGAVSICGAGEADGRSRSRGARCLQQVRTA